MDERYSRSERHRELYLNNDDHKFVMYFYYIIFPLVTIISLFFLTTINVKATTSIDVTSGITPGQSCSTHTANRYCSLNTCQTGDAGQVWSFGSTNDTCNVMAIQFYLNTTVGGYTANTLRLTGSNFRNTNYYCTSSVGGCTVVFVSSSQLNVNFQNNSASGINNPQFQINAYNDGFINNGQSWKLSKITYLYNDIGQGQTSTDQIINNQNSNNQEVIENNNANTETIVNNILQTIDTIKYGMNTCYKNYFNIQNVGYNQASTGIVERVGTTIKVQSTNNVNTDVSSGKTLKQLAPDLAVGSSYRLSYTRDSNSLNYIYLLGSNAVWQNETDRVITQSDLNSTVIFYTAKNTTGYLYRFMIQSSSGAIATHFVPYGEECSNKLDTIYDSQQETNDLIKDDSIDQSQANSFFDDFETSDNGGISTIITKPLTIINNLLSNNSSCTALALPDFMGATNVSLPSGCILWDNAPSSVVTIWNIFIVGLGSYWVLKSLFNDIQRLKDPDDDKVEVMDL